MKKIFEILILMQTLLAANENSFFENLPKAELHLHLGGSYPKEYLFSIATLEQREELERKLEWIANGVNYHEGFQVFQLINQLINSEERVRKGAEALCSNLQKDGVVYVEIRTGLKDLENGPEGYLKAVLEGIKACESDKFKANVILSLRRHSSMEMAKTTIDLALKYRDEGVIGIDISDDSKMGDIVNIMPELVRAKEAGLIFVVHMGEVPNEKDQMILLESLEPKRIGHGVHLSEEAREWILREKTPLEVCLSSSVLVQMIEQFDHHPGLELYRMGHPIIFCTDDPLIFSTTLSKELEHAHQFGMLSKEEIEQIVEGAFSHAIR